MSLLKRIFAGKPTAAPAPFTAPLAPVTAFHVIGDIHGRIDLLDRLLETVETDRQGADIPLVFVGDYVDRGEHSAQVLRRVHELAQRDDRQVICLIGNHEDMMLKFLADPGERGKRWLKYGGLQTLTSFGVKAKVSENASEAAMERARDALVDAMGPDLIDWLSNLPTYWQTGNVAVVHAGADPALPVGEQETRTHMWGHPDFRHKTRSDDTWVVHGHTIVDAACAVNGRISTDTGAFATGRLSAAFIEPGNVRFLTA